jgi:catechol 2,3-dioxygenase-like lactoylglutathione lyase family enzyme
MNIRIHHMALTCKEVDATETFYCRHLGFRRVRTCRPGEPGQFVMIRNGDFCLELFGGGTDSEPPKMGFKHLCFEVDDVDAWYNRLKDVAEFTSEPKNSTISPWLRLAFFKDPDGNMIELNQGWKDTE